MTTLESTGGAAAASPQSTGAFRSPALALALAALFWSGNFIAGRALRGQIDPLTLNFARWLFALVLLAPFVWRDAVAHRRALCREWRLILALGATGIASFHTLVYLALKSTTATNALLMLSLTPIVTLFGAAALGMEQPNKRQLAGALLSVVGAAVLITRGSIAAIVSEGFNAGDLLMLLAVLIWAAYSLLLRRRPADLPAPAALAASIIAALVLMLPVLPLAASSGIAPFRSVPVLLSVGYIAAFASAIAFLFWSYGVTRLGPARAAQFVQLMPIFGAALAIVLLGELPTAAQIGGAVLVLSGIGLVERTPRTRLPAVTG
jgi:drug/metabolite transporter (DMT)-like permease